MVRHEVLCAMVNNCSVLDFELVILRIRIHHKDRILKFFHHVLQKMKKDVKISGACKKLQPDVDHMQMYIMYTDATLVPCECAF